MYFLHQLSTSTKCLLSICCFTSSVGCRSFNEPVRQQHHLEVKPNDIKGKSNSRKIDRPLTLQYLERLLLCFFTCLRGGVSDNRWIKVIIGLGHYRALIPQGSSTHFLSLSSIPCDDNLQLAGVRTIPHTCDKFCFPHSLSRPKKQFNLALHWVWDYIFNTEHELRQHACKVTNINIKLYC